MLEGLDHTRTLRNANNLSVVCRRLTTEYEWLEASAAHDMMLGGCDIYIDCFHVRLVLDEGIGISLIYKN